MYVHLKTLPPLSRITNIFAIVCVHELVCVWNWFQKHFRRFRSKKVRFSLATTLSYAWRSIRAPFFLGINVNEKYNCPMIFVYQFYYKTPSLILNHTQRPPTSDMFREKHLRDKTVKRANKTSKYPARQMKAQLYSRETGIDRRTDVT